MRHILEFTTEEVQLLYDSVTAMIEGNRLANDQWDMARDLRRKLFEGGKVPGIEDDNSKATRPTTVGPKR
jgi:hypothetical protein